MRVAILGSGNVGTALASSLTRAGHDVTLTASNPDNARAAASQTGAQAASSNRQAIADAEVVVLAVQYRPWTPSWPRPARTWTARC